MKTQNKFRTLANRKLFMVMLVIATGIVALSSCGRTKTSDASLTQPAPSPAVVSDEIFVNVDEMPLFKDGDKGLMNYIKSNTNYPEEAKKNNVTGRVLVKFVVEKDCSVSQVEITQGVSPLLDAEALRVVKSLPKFEKPAKKAGETVRVQFMLPITFALH
jgi:TonB family protein